MTYSIETAADFDNKSNAKRCIAETVDEHTIAQAEFDAHIEALSSDIAPEIEIDSLEDCDFGILYRVWYTSKLIGNFYRRTIDGQWVAMPLKSDNSEQCNTAAEAQLFIVAAAGLLVANKADEEFDIDQLLSKPFDELTLVEWEALKAYEPQLEDVDLVAA